MDIIEKKSAGSPSELKQDIHPCEDAEQKIIDVNTGEVKVSTEGTILRSVAIGSCVAVATINFKRKIGGMAHIMLPGIAPLQSLEKTKYAFDGIEQLLNRMGVEVTIAEDGNKAIEKALVQEFDLILMDIQMPKMNGYEVTKTLRKQGITTPIVALTANAMKGDDKKCLEAGCDDYLAKPIDHGELLEKISKYLPSETKALSKTIDSAKS